MQTIECSGRTQVRLPEPQRCDFGQGKLRMTCGNQLGDDRLGGAAGLDKVGDVEVALLRIGDDARLGDVVKAGPAQEALDGAGRRVGARTLLLFANVGRAGVEAVNGQCQAARRRKGAGAFVGQTGIHQTVRHQTLEIVGGLRLHAGGNLFGEELNEKIGHGGPRVLPACRRSSCNAASD